MTLQAIPQKLLFAGFFSLVLLGGCTTPLTPDFLSMSKKYSNILEQYQIDMIFSNIIRSSLDRPLSFLDMPNITGTGSITTTPSVSTSFIGMSSALHPQHLYGALASVSPSLSMQVGNSFNFSQASLDNSLFWKSFLAPIELQSSQYFIHNHIPRELILSLILDEIIITSPNGKQKKLLNNPLRPEYPEFQKELYQLIAYGLSVQHTFNSLDEGVPMTEKELEKNYGANPKQLLAQNGMKLKQVVSSPIARYQLIKLQPAYKLCIDKNEFENFVKQNYGADIFCKESETSQAASQNKTKEPSLNFSLRSTKNIYDYLGQVVQAQLANPPYLVTLPASESTLVKKNNESNRFALLVVNRNTGGRTFASMDSLDDDTYSIPRENNGYSMLIINLLAQFQTLAKSPGSIPSSPAVLIK
jgi:hypothetical protein